MSVRRHIGILSVLALGLGLPVPCLGAEAEATTIKVGMASAFSGPSQELGLKMRAGVQTYFDLVNADGGINGKKLQLISIDDGYEPSRTGPAMRKLIDEDKVFAILGNVGTPTASVAVPIATEKGIPFFGAFSGAGVLRKTPPDHFIVNFRASYAEETAEMVRGFVKELGIKPEEIGFFTQNDSYGDSGYEGGVAALKKLGYINADRAPHGRYPRNTEDVEEGLSILIDPSISIKAIIMVGVYKPCAKFIKMAKKRGLKVIFANVSFVGSDTLIKELGPLGEGVVVTQVVPPMESDLYIVKHYRHFTTKEKQNFISLEGFIAARSFVESLKAAGDKATPSSLIQKIESGFPIDLGLSTPVSLSASEHQFSHTVWATVIHNGKNRALNNWNDLRAQPVEEGK